jgi:FMN reductase
MMSRPLIVGIGGSPRANSSTEKALRISLVAAADAGADVVPLVGQKLVMPIYNPEDQERSSQARELVDLIRNCDGLLISSPSYHGTLSAFIKNALDYTEDLRNDSRPYLDGRAVGCIACAHGWQATGTTLNTLRSIVHALRGWPTPFGAAINSQQTSFSANGECTEAAVRSQLEMVGRQVVEFALMKRRATVANA